MGTNLLSFPHYFDAHVAHVRIVPKANSDFMRRLGNLLDFTTTLHLTSISREQFLHEYTTTLWDTIYSDEITMDSGLSPLLIHELCHVLQFRSKRMPLEYALSPRRRAYYESEAVQAELLCWPHRIDRIDPEYVLKRVEHLRAYGIDAATAEAAIRARLREIQQAEPQPRSLLVADALEAWRNQ